MLLPTDALNKARIGLSASNSPDLPRLGLLDDHLRLALGEIMRSVLLSSGHLIYGGHLRPTGYTSLMINELHRYARRDRPLTVCLAWSVHRKMRLSQLEASMDELGLYGQIICLGMDGSEVQAQSDRTEEPDPPLAPDDEQRSLTSLRRYLTEHSNARILVGGKRADFGGRIPGLMEEALLALKANQAVFLAGGFGGATLDVIRALEIDDASWFPTPQTLAEEDARLIQGRAELSAFRRSSGWSGLNNGLSDEENVRLAASHRPTDIAALIAIGLGRVLTDRS